MSRVLKSLVSLLPCLLVSFAVSAEVNMQVEAVPEAPAERFPVAISARPFTLPMGVFELDVNAKGGWGIDADAGEVVGKLGSRARLGIGVTDDVQLDVYYSGMDWLNMTPSQGMELGLGVFTGANSVFANMVYFLVPLGFDQDNIATSIGFAAPTVFGLGAGFSLMALAGDGFIQYRFLPTNDADRVAIEEGGAPVWNGMNASFHLPLALKFQAGQSVYMSLETELASWSTTGTHSYVWEKTPLALKSTVSVNNQIDIGLKLGFEDVQKPSETFGGMLSVTLRAGALDA